MLFSDPFYITKTAHLNKLLKNKYLQNNSTKYICKAMNMTICALTAISSFKSVKIEEQKSDKAGSTIVCKNKRNQTLSLFV